jgi:hypothetical protein
MRMAQLMRREPATNAVHAPPRTARETAVIGRIRGMPHRPRKRSRLPSRPSANLTATALVRKGYLPRELPPTFSTEKLAALLERSPTVLPRTGGRTEPARHNLARPGGFRRPLQVPNPRSFVRLADECESQWTRISSHVGSNPFSMSTPVVTRTLERAIRPRFRFGERDRLRPLDWRGQRFLLRTDISQFYSSLYTHSIPWALEGKQFAKQNIGRTQSDPLDKALRDISDGQTMGVPIGPDTSFLAAEIVLTAVDGAMAKKVRLRGHRYIDDYELAFRSRSEAEQAQALLEEELARYELAINPTKTVILELPQPFLESWTHELSTFPIRSGNSSQTLTDLLALFSRAAALARSTSGPLKYALLRSRDAQIDSDIWDPFQNLVWSAVSAEPTTMATALDVLGEKTEPPAMAINKDGATEMIEGLILTHSPVRNASEVAWALWAAILLDVPLSAEIAKSICAMEDDFVALLALDAASRGVFRTGQLDLTAWETSTDYDGVLEGPHWLLAYEGSVRKWLSAPRKRVGSDSFFRVLRARKVRFYNGAPKRNPFTGPAGPLPGGLVPDDYG